MGDLHIVDTTKPEKFRWFPATMRTVAEFEPCPRMCSISTIKDSVLYLYGGLFEDGDAQFTLNDFWSLDLKRMNGWKLLNESDEFGMEWHGSDMEESSEESEEEQDSDDPEPEPEPKPKKKKKKKQDKSKWSRGKAESSIFDQHPQPIQDEDFEFYYTRTNDYWLKLMRQACQDVFENDPAIDEDGNPVPLETIIDEAAQNMAKSYFKLQRKGQN